MSKKSTHKNYFASKKTKKSKKSSKPPVITLTERVDISVLERLLYTKSLTKLEKDQLRDYYLSFDKETNLREVNYFYSKSLGDKGRIYAENGLSLQSFKKIIRHALARDYYLDVDMKNAHPTLMVQYCEKHNIDCDNLKNYVENRDKMLKKVMRYHQVTRDEAKVLFLRLCFLGGYVLSDKKNVEYVPEKSLSCVVRFKNEMKEIAHQVCKIEKEIYKFVMEDDTKKNKLGATLSILAQTLEYNCLMAMKDFFNVRTPYKVGVLCFDGLMVESYKDDQENDKKIIENLFPDCYDFVEESTGYRIELDIKPMELPPPADLPPYTPFVNDDLECAEKLLMIEGKEKFIYCEGNFYIFDERTGTFGSKGENIHYYLIKNKEYLQIQSKGIVRDSYGRTLSLMRRIPDVIITLVVTLVYSSTLYLQSSQTIKNDFS